MKVFARISLLPTESGGRTQPLTGSLRANHSFAPDKFVVGQIEQEPGAMLSPGDNANLVVDFIPDGLPTLTAGVEWNIYDGPTHLIGSGTILKVIGS